MRLNDERRIKGFDGLRAIAFLFVFISHKFHQGTYGSLGGDGVMLFFALSGLLITRILARTRLAIEAGAMTTLTGLGRFYVRRSARIFPVYYATIGLFLIASLFVHFEGFEGGARLAMLLYATNIYVLAAGHWVGHFNHFWTLAVEEQFYLLFAPLLLLSPSKAAQHICVAFIALSLVSQAGLEWAGVPATEVVGVNPVTSFGYLAMGGLAGLSLDRRMPAWLVSTPAQASAVLALLIVPLTVLMDPIIWRIYAPAVSATAALLISQIAQNQSSRFVVFLESWPLRSLGRISYGCYIFHEFVHFYDIEPVVRKLGGKFDTPDWITAPIELIVTVGLATLSWRFFERPIMAWAHRATQEAAPVAGRYTAAVSSLRGRPKLWLTRW